jgi:hypothetical protein
MTSVGLHPRTWLRRSDRGEPARVDVGEYLAPPPRADPPIDDLVDEAMMIAESAARLALANHLLVRAVRDGAAHSPEHVAEDARQELLRVAAESENGAKELDDVIAVASTRGGRARRQDDYRAEDVDRLERRRDILLLLADRLRTAAEDAETTERVGRMARDAALDGILSAYALANTRRPATDPSTLEERRALVRADLLRLLNGR